MNGKEVNWLSGNGAPGPPTVILTENMLDTKMTVSQYSEGSTDRVSSEEGGESRVDPRQRGTQDWGIGESCALYRDRGRVK